MIAWKLSRLHGGSVRVKSSGTGSGPLFMGKHTHALSPPAERIAMEVLAANGVETFIQRDDGFTPTPVISKPFFSVYWPGGGAAGNFSYRIEPLAKFWGLSRV